MPLAFTQEDCLVFLIFADLILNDTLEERVTLLETQVVELEEDLTVLNEDVIGLRLDHTQLEGDVNFLFDETVIQDERIFSLEQDNDIMNQELEGESELMRYFSPTSL